MESGNESDAPEELTTGEGVKQHEELTKAQRENVIRAAKEGKERRRQWAQRKTPSKSKKEKEQTVETGDDELEAEDAPVIPGMLPKDIVDLLTAREKQTFSSDSEDEIVNIKAATKEKSKKKKRENNGPETIVLTEMAPPKCLENSMNFLKKRKMQVARSDSILRNANQCLRLLSSKGGLLSKT